MDRHEKGIEKLPGRLDRPLTEWNGSYWGDPKRLPKVVQKLILKRILSAEEKAELLWRFFELDQQARHRRARIHNAIVWSAALLLIGYIAIFQRTWVAEHVMAWLSPPPSSPA
jgi:hypothetical protein